jgi:membrane protease YdiL (CAAX protease family)
MENDQLEESPVLERRQGGILLAACFVGFFLSQIVAAVVAGVATNTIAHQGLTHFLDTHFERPWWLTASEMFGLWLGFAAIVVLAMKRVRPVLPTGFFSVRWTDLKFLPLGVLLQALVGALYYPFHIESAGDPVKQVVGHNPTYGMLVIMFFVGIGAPLIEELLFRGVILQSMTAIVTPRVRAIAAGLVPALLTGVVFGAAHGELVQLAGLTLVGTILAVIVQRQRRVAPAIFTHAGFNLIALSVAWASVAVQ